MRIAITGSPGVGKHTVSREILKQSELSLWDINEIAKEKGFFESNGDSNDVDVVALRKIIDKSISDNILVVGHLAPYVISPERIDKIIVLRRNPYDLLKVYKKRGYALDKSKDNAGSEILGIIAHDALSKFGDKVFQINITGKSIEEVSNIIMRIIKDDYLSEKIDWLELINSKNDLRKFFAY